ncbi:MAG TPA: peptidoglycan DD-metalloendopeptidase family protein [Xanthobacteraceae bacterium]|nr:peptidoglycan DD-metalloendopeptidase family protein [Xanthobacteraceae bacterium]
MTSRRVIGLAFGSALSAGLAAVALAQQPAPAPDKAARQQELDAVQAEQRRAADAEALLKNEIAALGEDRRKLNEALLTTVGRLRLAESRIAAAEARLKTLEANERTVRKSLDGRRAVIAEILAALERIGRRPPPAIMTAPEDALLSVRTAMLLGAVLPEMRVEAEALSADLAELARVRKDMGIEKATLGRDVAAFSDDQQRMTLLVQERQKKQAEAEKALDAQRQHIALLARQADNLKDLIAKLERDAAAQPGGQRPPAPPEGKPNFAALKDPGRLAPAVAFASAKGALPLPVNGVRIRDFGTPDGLGGTEKGLWIASRAAAPVTAPCDGWVVYAGPFRSYGQLLILNAGGGYHVLLAGMERISVDPGQFVLTGEPVAVMGGGPQSAAAVATGSSQPVLYVEFRKDGTPVDPSPWWATTDSEKVRG